MTQQEIHDLKSQPIDVQLGILFDIFMNPDIAIPLSDENRLLYDDFKGLLRDIYIVSSRYTYHKSDDIKQYVINEVLNMPKHRRDIKINDILDI